MTAYNKSPTFPILVEPMALAHDLTLFISIQLVSDQYPLSEPLNISASAIDPLPRDTTGILHLNIWEDVGTSSNLACCVFEVGAEFMNLKHHRVSDDWRGAGLVFLGCAIAQGSLGWSRYLIGTDEFRGW